MNQDALTTIDPLTKRLETAGFTGIQAIFPETEEFMILLFGYPKSVEALDHPGWFHLATIDEDGQWEPTDFSIGNLG